MIPEDLSQDIPNGNVPQNAVSLYGQNDAADDFPVLKAFQEYVNAEQEKARKRLVTICSFFGIFLFLVVAVFVFLLWDSGRRKEQLYDRLIQSIEDRTRAAALAERPAPAPAPVVVQQPVAAPAAPAKDPEQAAALKAVAEALAALKKDVEEQKKKSAEEKSPSQLAVEKRNREDTDKLLRERAKLDAEKRRLEDEKERMRKAEVERQRRRLYPDYYDADGNLKKNPEKKTEASAAPAAPAKPAAAKPTYTDQDIQDILVEADKDAVDYFADADEDEEKPTAKSKKKSTKKASAKKKPAKKESAPKDEETQDEDDEAEEAGPTYEGDDYKLSVKGKGKGKSSSWDIPLTKSEE